MNYRMLGLYLIESLLAKENLKGDKIAPPEIHEERRLSLCTILDSLDCGLELGNIHV